MKCSVVGCNNNAEYSMEIDFQAAGFFCYEHAMKIKEQKPKFEILSKECVKNEEKSK